MIKRNKPTHSFAIHVVAMTLMIAILLSGIVASRPLTEKSKPQLGPSVVDAQRKLAAGLGDTTPTDDAAKSVPVSTRTEQQWILAPALNPESVRSIRFISPELAFESIVSPRFVTSRIIVRSSLGDISTLLPYRFALVGQRPSGTS